MVDEYEPHEHKDTTKRLHDQGSVAVAATAAECWRHTRCSDETSSEKRCSSCLRARPALCILGIFNVSVRAVNRTFSDSVALRCEWRTRYCRWIYGMPNRSEGSWNTAFVTSLKVFFEFSTVDWNIMEKLRRLPDNVLCLLSNGSRFWIGELVFFQTVRKRADIAIYRETGKVIASVVLLTLSAWLCSTRRETIQMTAELCDECKQTMALMAGTRDF